MCKGTKKMGNNKKNEQNLMVFFVFSPLIRTFAANLGNHSTILYEEVYYC